jgi:pimeloyl-ACP methyl ester carboxylesterase
VPGRSQFAVLALLLAAVAPCRGQVFSDFTAPLPLKPGNTLVIGFLGGWERWDDSNRAVRKLALKLREERHQGVFVETISNHERRLALELVWKAFDWNQNGRIDPEERAGARIILYGQSMGGAAAVKLARELKALQIPVLLTVQIDSVGSSDGVIPSNVSAAANLFQHDGPPIMGRKSIRAEDPSRTRILGNFQYRYWFRNVDMSSASWPRKTLGGAHARMEQDPKVWEQVERLILGVMAGR